MSDASAHSTTSGTSSPYASGSVFHRLNANDLKYRDEKPKILRSYIVGKMLGEGMLRRFDRYSGSMHTLQGHREREQLIREMV